VPTKPTLENVTLGFADAFWPMFQMSGLTPGT
jgi:hypothetical protein